MGTWGSGSFENDEASDWAWELKEAKDLSILETAFARVTGTDGYLEATDCWAGIAAAEVLAALRGRPAEGLPDEVVSYVARVRIAPSIALVASAVQALQRVKTKSELQELWDESDSSNEWHQTVAELETRLR